MNAREAFLTKGLEGTHPQKPRDDLSLLRGGKTTNKLLIVYLVTHGPFSAGAKISFKSINLNRLLTVLVTDSQKPVPENANHTVAKV